MEDLPYIALQTVYAAYPNEARPLLNATPGKGSDAGASTAAGSEIQIIRDVVRKKLTIHLRCRTISRRVWIAASWTVDVAGRRSMCNDPACVWALSIGGGGIIFVAVPAQPAKLHNTAMIIPQCLIMAFPSLHAAHAPDRSKSLDRRGSTIHLLMGAVNGWVELGLAVRKNVGLVAFLILRVRVRTDFRICN